MARNLILIGMPAVGKSTVGVLLAKQLGFAFLDTDLLIQSGEGRKLSRLIHDKGVEGFCDMEAGYVGRLCVERTVVATGGSVVYRSAAMTHLTLLGRIVFLDIDVTALASRLNQLDERGVVRIDGQTLESLFAERQPLYSRYAQWTIACGGRTPDQVVQAVVEAMRRDPLFVEFV